MSKINGLEVIAVSYGSNNGGIEAFKLEDGSIMEYKDALYHVMRGECEGLRVQDNAYGLYIKTEAGMNPAGNLSSLPTF